MERKSEIDRIIARHFGGSTVKACEAFGVTKGAISQWRKGIPPMRRYHIESIIKAQPSTAETPPTG